MANTGSSKPDNLVPIASYVPSGVYRIPPTHCVWNIHNITINIILNNSVKNFEKEIFILILPFYLYPWLVVFLLLPVSPAPEGCPGQKLGKKSLHLILEILLHLLEPH